LCGAGQLIANNSNSGQSDRPSSGAGIGAGSAVGNGDPNCQPDKGNIKKVRRGRQRQLKSRGVDFEELKKDVQANSRQDVFQDECDNFYVGNKDGSGEFEFIGNFSHLF